MELRDGRGLAHGQPPCRRQSHWSPYPPQGARTEKNEAERLVVGGEQGIRRPAVPLTPQPQPLGLRAVRLTWM